LQKQQRTLYGCGNTKGATVSIANTPTEHRDQTIRIAIGLFNKMMDPTRADEDQADLMAALYATVAAYALAVVERYVPPITAAAFASDLHDMLEARRQSWRIATRLATRHLRWSSNQFAV
jgi:hypothetical protein